MGPHGAPNYVVEEDDVEEDDVEEYDKKKSSKNRQTFVKVLIKNRQKRKIRIHNFAMNRLKR